MTSQGKRSKDPCTGDCNVARFIRVEIEAAPWVSSVPSACPAMEKVQPCLQQGQDKSQCPAFLLHIKA